MQEMKKSMSSFVRPSTADPLAGSPLGQKLAHTAANGSPAQRRLAETILRSPVRLASASIEELAEAAGASPATVSRFARDMGVSGYAELRARMAEALQEAMDPVAKLRGRLAGGIKGRDETSMIEAGRAQLALIDANELGAGVAALAARIKAARSVHVMGFGLSAHVAGMLVLGLQPYHPAVQAVVEFGGTEVAAGRLMAIGADDLLIALTVRRYASDVVRLARFAKARGTHIAVLTDSPASPLVPLADSLIVAPSEHPVLASSLAAMVLTVETLAGSLMLLDEGNAERAAALADAIGGYLHSN